MKKVTFFVIFIISNYAYANTIFFKIKNSLTNEVRSFKHPSKTKKNYEFDDLSCWLSPRMEGKLVSISCSSTNPDKKRMASQVIPLLSSECKPEVA